MPSQLQVLHRRRGFIMKGRVKALYENMKAMGGSEYLTQKEKEDLLCARSVISEILSKFDLNTRILKMKKFGK